MKQVVSLSPEDTLGLGRDYAARLRPGDVVALMGELGSGKTQFVAGICEGLGVRGHVASPTFTFINEYAAPFGTVAHIDLYRIDSR
ncbi:MAG: tRNA (adenosine(37)-N6)-threonylcarbamoyltransferase complex ATPase subunit type 1 TsaE, partial [Bacteroidetes bacterium]|nr:tRNA (adenosine(37)-N6)-threonylcarbamoyltransferase complex ATPase subunit type 1 TsaE [Bacteroidota bacterium]